MKNRILILSLLCLIVLPIISADMVSPGYRGISINNYIENINNFPDYVFISGGSIGTGMCPLKIISDDGKIESYYKFCDVFVYAIPKNELNETKIEKMNSNSTQIEEVKSYLDSIGGKEVLNNINTYKTVPITSSIEEENNYFNISLSQVKVDPDEKIKTRNNLIYFYIIAPIVAILIIVFILIKRKK